VDACKIDEQSDLTAQVASSFIYNVLYNWCVLMFMRCFEGLVWNGASSASRKDGVSVCELIAKC
jgi:hypothetical protein